jgi:hypothetical protein
MKTISNGLGGTMNKQRQRRTYQQIFLDTLGTLSNGEQKLVSNYSLRERLDWPQDLYNRIKSELKTKNAIILGRGHGGTVALANAPGTRVLSIFISYSHTDEPLKNELVKHLKPLERLGLVDQWHDRKIKAGDEIDATISAHLKSSDIILLVVSIDFLNSKYCFDIELEEAIRRHDAGEARVIPIIARSCLWTQMPFAKLLALPKDGKAISSWEHQDDALANVAEGVKAVADQLLESR